RGAVTVPHDNVRLDGEIAVRGPPGQMRATNFSHDHLLDLEADQQRNVAFEVEQGHLHDYGKIDVVPAHTPDIRHAAAMKALLQMEAINRLADRQLALG